MRVRKWLGGQAALAAALRSVDAPVSVVGGAVRDALLERPHGPDVDLVVEGDALAVARRLGRSLGAFVVPYERFGTARLELPHGGEIDIVTARREWYPAPGALPVVEPGTLADDLARRDFSINAMAYRVTGRDAGEIVDPHGGRRDLAGATVRVLRDDAFVEDPSRVVRAARYASRLRFLLDPRTAALAAGEAPRLRIDNARVADELTRLLGEDSAAAAVAMLRRLGTPWLGPVDGLGDAFAAIDAALRRPGAPPLPAWPL
ncbi:MAG: polynucleotide adenylyltransferase, partial [Actinomycetota bacterium]